MLDLAGSTALGLGSLLSVCVLVLFKCYLTYTTGTCRSSADLRGKTVVVTGANAGIGFYTALDFARRNAQVILACRNLEKAEKAREKIIQETGNEKVIAKRLELSSLKSVRSFAEEIIMEHSKLHILVNNAGVTGFVNKSLTEDGFEYTFAVNHFGPFLLTNLLLDLLRNSGQARIVTVSSIAYLAGKIDFDNLHSEKSYSTGRVYFDSKLANILFTKELAASLQGTDVVVYCCHPGTVQTDLFRYLPSVYRWIIYFVGLIFFKSPKVGAQTSIYCAVAEGIEHLSGSFFVDCKLGKESAKAKDMAVARKLWEVSERLTGIT